MTITLNHTIVSARDKRAAAQFFARIFGLRAEATISRLYVSTITIAHQMALFDTAFLAAREIMKYLAQCRFIHRTAAFCGTSA